MQVGELAVFMTGDARGSAVQHEASDDGHIAGMNATAERTVLFKRRTPLSIVFSQPNVAMVGQTFAELDSARVVMGEAQFDRQARARIEQKNVGLLRVYADRDSGLLLGAELCAPAGEHLAHLLGLAIERALTVADLLRTPFYHPTLEEGLRTALRKLSEQLPARSGSDLISLG